jgi:type I site-specific restriction endonuclease
VVIARVINSMTEFKQIIGRGTRVRDDYGKLFFSILDYTGSATRLFADPDFDGEPALITEEKMDETGTTTGIEIIDEEPPIVDPLSPTPESPGEELAEAAGQPDADPFDLLCHIANNAPIRTRRERAQLLRREKKDFFEKYGPEARAVLNDILEKYVEYGTAQFQIPEILKVPPISQRGTVTEIIRLFGGAQHMRNALAKMQQYLYAA